MYDEIDIVQNTVDILKQNKSPIIVIQSDPQQPEKLLEQNQVNFYQKLSDYLSIYTNKIDLLESSGLSEIITTILSIPIIFIISLIILKKFRKIISADLDKATLGIILDKFFGIIYGFIFSYFIFSILLLLIEQINSDFIQFLNYNSFILSNINDINNSYIYKYIPFFFENSDSLTN